MSDFEFNGSAMDQLLHSPTGAVGKFLKADAEQTALELEEEARNVMRGFGDFVKEPTYRTEAGELVAEIGTKNSKSMEQRLSRKAEDERLASWMGRAMRRRHGNVV
jgi:hypothetical protein